MRKWPVWFSIISLALMLVSGCAVSRKPAPPSPAAPGPAPAAPGPAAPAPRPLPTTPAEAHRLATKLAAEAEKVPGVKSATVVLTGNTAIVGLDIKSGVERGRTAAIKDEVARRVRAADNRVVTVQVTTDPDTVTRIRRVAQGISRGEPVASFNREIQEILRRITPTTR
ncbi:YhcN/YlaJ family sporulation lipoprotein [Desulfofundulus sp. TPOSR]|uniref:YhcN/YlaJ family sporulation lipoprotein n=1 Tax=Desulfofundulus sp. TPOSR TaxID=2714340 RepID=UPI00140E8A33|nr:YhcN/YlaJ family sporulation lipoprotein [Desulfofundulus sp. TPOSR]NHM27347.1 YhcN/YlaJ family sporulation lipoprotein [Desulfofundulus sp. TPOSR]